MCLTFYCFVYSVPKHLLSICHMPGTVLGAGELKVKEIQPYHPEALCLSFPIIKIQL